MRYELTLLILAVLGFDSRYALAQQLNPATTRLKAISESLDSRDLDEIRLLIAKGADVNANNKYGLTPLFVASFTGHTEIVKLLLGSKADVNRADTSYGETPLSMASECGHTEVVKLLLTAHADVNAANKKGTTALLKACTEGHGEIVRLLLQSKADVNATARSDGVTPLFMASANGDAEVTKLLLAAGANVNTREETQGMTALSIATQEGRVEVVKLLLAAKADVDDTNKTDGATALAIASMNGHAEIVRLLLAAKASIIVTTSDGRTPLLLASTGGHTETVKVLIEAKADVNVRRASDGLTSLLAASDKGHVDVVRLLLSAGADMNAKATSKGKQYTALDTAKLRGHAKIVELLKEHETKANNSAVTHSQAAEVGESRVYYPLSIPRSDDSIAGALTFKKPKGLPTAMMLTERPGDHLVFVDRVWNEPYKDYEFLDFPRQVVGTGVGSEIRFGGLVKSTTTTISVPNGTRMCFRKDAGGWVYVCGLGEITSTDKTATFGHSRTVASCLALLKTSDPILQEGAARDLGRLTQAADYTRVVSELAALLKSTNPVLRQAAVEGLGLIGTRDSQVVLLDAARVEQDEATRERLKEALCMIGAYVLTDDPAAAGLQEEEAARHYLAMAVEDTRWLPWLHEVVACRALSRGPAAKAALKSRSTSANAVAADAAKRLMSELDKHVEVLGLSW